METAMLLLILSGAPSTTDKVYEAPAATAPERMSYDATPEELENVPASRIIVVDAAPALGQ